MFNSFDPDDETGLNDDIHLIAEGQAFTLVHDRQGNLSPERNTGGRQFLAQTVLIDRFQQYWPELPMDFNRHADDAAAQLPADALIEVAFVSWCLCG